MLDLDYTVKVRIPIAIFAILVTYGAVFWISTPTRKGLGYEPEQPIAFSHKLHAGDMQMDCRYCHVGVDKSRHATIPSVDTCMNCHATVKAVGRVADVFTYNDGQKTKVIPRKNTLDDVLASIERAQKTYKDSSKLFEGIIAADTEVKVAEILDGIITSEEKRTEFLKVYGGGDFQDKDIIALKKNPSLTEKESQKLCRFIMDSLFVIDAYKSLEIKRLTAHFESGKPLEWKRIYKLPEYAYFNHSVHIAKGIDCTNCHGNVADLDSMKKMKPITMGRCIDCHRGDYQEFHKDLKEKVRGPEDCGTCHR